MKIRLFLVQEDVGYFLTNEPGLGRLGSIVGWLGEPPGCTLAFLLGFLNFV